MVNSSKHILRRLALMLVALLGATILSAQEPDQLFKEGNKLYTSGKYKEAIEKYEAIIARGYCNAELYYNLGNAYFKSKDIARSILYYERALLLNPSDNDIRFNLELARTFTVDKISRLPDFFLVAFFKWIRNRASSDSWAYIALISFVLSLFLFVLFWFAPRLGLKRSSFYLSLLMMLVFVASLSFSISSKRLVNSRKHAIVVVPAVSVKSSPGNSGKDLFIIHSGIKVKIVRELENWAEITLLDGNKGWIRKDVFERI